jgi:hypothetical protein
MFYSPLSLGFTATYANDYSLVLSNRLALLPCLTSLVCIFPWVGTAGRANSALVIVARKAWTFQAENLRLCLYSTVISQNQESPFLLLLVLHQHYSLRKNYWNLFEFF